eukprot:4044951-Pyramimonas_sp.AAC.3
MRTSGEGRSYVFMKSCDIALGGGTALICVKPYVLSRASVLSNVGPTPSVLSKAFVVPILSESATRFDVTNHKGGRRGDCYLVGYLVGSPFSCVGIGVFPWQSSHPRGCSDGLWRGSWMCTCRTRTPWRAPRKHSGPSCRGKVWAKCCSFRGRTQSCSDTLLFLAARNL